MEIVDGYTLLHLFYLLGRVKIESAYSQSKIAENLDLPLPTFNRYWKNNPDKRPWCPRDLLKDNVVNFASKLLAEMYGNDVDRMMDDFFLWLRINLDAPNTSSELKKTYDEEKQKSDADIAFKEIITIFYEKCRSSSKRLNDKRNNAASPSVPSHSPKERASIPEINELKDISKKSFAATVKALRYIVEPGGSLESLNIVEEWLPTVDSEQRKLSDYVFDHIRSAKLAHSAVYSEPGVGKTYSFFDTFRKLLTMSLEYEGKPVVPVYLSSLLLSMSGKSILNYIVENFFDRDDHLAAEVFEHGAVAHFVLLIDALNEGVNESSLLSDAVMLSLGKKNLTLIVSSNNTDEILTLKQSGFEEIVLNELDMNVVDGALEGSVSSTAFKRLLCRPFYLKNYLQFKEKGYSADTYSVIESYIQNCKRTGKAAKIQSIAKWSALLDGEFSDFCYRCTINNKMYVSVLESNLTTTFEFLKSKENINRLEQIGLLKSYGRPIEHVYFEHEIYRNFFAAKYLHNKICELFDHSNAPDELRLQKVRDFIIMIKNTPANVYKILAPKLFHEGLLAKSLKEIGPLVNNQSSNQFAQSFFREIVNLFSFATNTLENLDFNRANLWMTDFTRFDKILNCNFENANLNPETLWLHHAKISYTSTNSGRICKNLIFLSGPEGFEVYNWENDNQLFIHLPQRRIVTSWSLSISNLTVQTGNGIYRVSIDEIMSRLYSNTGTSGEDLLLSDSYIIVNPASESDQPLEPIAKNNRGDELIYTPGDSLFVQEKGKATYTHLSDICKYATFIDADSDNVFADCDGVYIKMTTEGILNWKRMVKPIVPNVCMKGPDGLVIEMEMPGVTESKFFQYNYTTKKMSFLERDEVDKLEKNGFTKSKEGLTKNYVDSDVLEVTEGGGTYIICGGAIDFTGSVFDNATIVCRMIDEKERMVLSTFGGIFI